VIIIRHSALKDLPRVIRIERISFGPDSYSVSTFLAHVMRDRKGLLVAVGEEGEVLGYALVRTSLGWVGLKRGGITSIAVSPAHRRVGAGRALMDCALEYLRDQGVKQADLEVGVDNRAAQSLYEACGFRRSHLMPHYYGLKRDGIKMVLDLDVAPTREQGREPTRVGRAING
jgi:ribosomal protein S18 acetylase RimI-like enzyme